MIRIFSGSVKRGFAQKRGALRNHERNNAAILTLARTEPKTTQRILVLRLDITLDRVNDHLDRWRKPSAVRHLGTTKKARWEVLR